MHAEPGHDEMGYCLCSLDCWRRAPTHLPAAEIGHFSAINFLTKASGVTYK
jgi:hypothetical protein